MAKILIVEDELKLREELKIFLESNNYDVNAISTFTNTEQNILNIKCDLILLDINLPGVNGEIICKNLRKNIDTPIIILTSKNTDIDEIISIKYGADDFITKPFNPQVLLARIERLLDRKKNINILNYFDLTIDFTKSLINKGENIVDLSRNENKILLFLLKNKGKIVSRDDLINFLWDNNEFVDDNTLTVNINRLRNKLNSIGLNDAIITKRGQGYLLV